MVTLSDSSTATGNCFILKPSERVPITSNKLFHLIEQAGFPAGVVQLIHGGKATVDAILDHPAISAVSFVGSTPVARYIYSRAAANGKRAQCQGGAKNPVIIMPDADMEQTTKILVDSAFGCAGQRCLAASVAISVGDSRKELTERVVEAARGRKVGYGLDEGVEMGPVITPESKARIEGLIEQGSREGAKVLVDGRARKVAGYEDGFFVFPTVLDEVPGTSASTSAWRPQLPTSPSVDGARAFSAISRRTGTQHLIEESDLLTLVPPAEIHQPAAWRRTATGEPMPDVVRAVRRSREGR